MKPRVSGLTARGRWVIGAGTALALAGWLFGIGELFCLALAALVLVVAARIWVDARQWNLQVSRIVHPVRVAAGQEARVELAVRNSSGRPSPPVVARDPFDGGRRWARFAIAPLRPGEVRTSSYRLPSAQRGVHRLGPLELRLTDPFGLASSTRPTAVETSLTVHPRYDAVTVHGTSSHRDDDRRSARLVMGKGGGDFYALRQYIPGDDLRHVHWPTTARVDDLVIRQPENVRRGRLTVVADLRAGVVDDETVERVLSGVASLAMSGLEAGLQVRVVTTAGWDSGHGTGRGHRPALLDGLAAAVIHRPQPTVAPFRMAGRFEPVAVVTTDRCTDADLYSAFGMGGPTGTTLVVFESGDGVARPRSTSWGSGRGRVVRVGRNESFPAAWGRLNQTMAPV
jgi:uncharacterized protein (DUF58 family)